MQGFTKKFKEWVYSLSTEDRYAEYNPNDPPNFNMGARTGQQNTVNPSRIHLTGDEEMDIGMNSHGNDENEYDDINIDDFADGNNTNGKNEGVSEALLAWRHIDAWTDEHNPDLNATLGDPVTNNDITHAEEDLEISLPPSVKVSMRIHDGQEDMESMTGTSGLIYGLQLMTLDQVVAMTQAWRNVAANLKRRQEQSNPSSTRPSTEGNSVSIQNPASLNSNQIANDQRNQFKLPFIPQQKSVPPESIQAVYAHPAWIPLITDNAGNHIGVDLAPGNNGHYGQVIIFGRDFDTKYVVAQNWGEFILSFANDLEEGNWYLIDDNDDYLSGDGELVFRDKKRGGPIQDYLEVLKKRVTFKYKKSINQSNSNIETENTLNEQISVQQLQPEPIPQQATTPTTTTIPSTDIDHDKSLIDDSMTPTEDEDDVNAIITDDEEEGEQKGQKEIVNEGIEVIDVPEKSETTAEPEVSEEPEVTEDPKREDAEKKEDEEPKKEEEKDDSVEKVKEEFESVAL